MSLHSSSSVNGEGSTPKDPLYKILDELRSLKLRKEKQERKEKGKKIVMTMATDIKTLTLIFLTNSCFKQAYYCLRSN